jgi:hypothetical protein
MAAPKLPPDAPLPGVSVRVVASTQAAHLLTPVLVELAGRGIVIREAGPGMWCLEVWAPVKRLGPRALARLRDACRRLAPHFCHPGAPFLHWEKAPPPRPVPKGEKRFFRPFLATPGLWVAPPGQRVEPAQGQRLLELELGRARGSGIHPATRCALRLLEGVLTQGPPPRALDVETGSGILALSAALWGVPRVLALDRSPHAVTTARRNVRRNGLVGRIKVRCLDLARQGGCHPLVTAHLPPRAAGRRAAALAHCVAPGGRLILGGIPHRRAREVEALLTPAFSPLGAEIEAWWAALLFRREQGPAPLGVQP